jgi:hypothetical protein
LVPGTHGRMRNIDFLAFAGDFAVSLKAAKDSPGSMQ